MNAKAYNYDGECENLARYFLGTPASQEAVERLAQAIQYAVEDWINDNAQPDNSPGAGESPEQR